jgi:hypothetical protein
MAAMLEGRDHAYEEEHPTEDRAYSRHSGGIRAFWQNHNHSTDGLPSLDSCISAERPLGIHQPPPVKPEATKTVPQTDESAVFMSERNKTLLIGFVLGAIVSATSGIILTQHASLLGALM